jgi:hypothetical protein
MQKRSEMMSKLKILPLLLTMLFLIACQKATTPVSDICSITEPHTALEFGKYTVNIFGPNETVNPDIWEGPLCITNAGTQSTCVIDVSLIKKVSYNSDNGTLAVSIFSGSNAEDIQLDMDSCKLIKP